MFFFSYYFCNNIFFLLAYFIVNTQYIIHTTYKIWVKRLLPVRLPVNSRLLVVKFWGSQKLYIDFQLCGALAPVTPTMFKSQLYLPIYATVLNSLNKTILVNYRQKRISGIWYLSLTALLHKLSATWRQVWGLHCCTFYAKKRSWSILGLNKYIWWMN